MSVYIFMSSVLRLQSHYAEKRDKESINSLPVVRWDGDIHLISRDEELPQAIEALRQEKVLGFDTETRPSFRKGTSYDPTLIQLAGHKVVYLFQITQLQDHTLLAALLADPEIYKVGVGLSQDIRQLQAIFSFEPGGFVDVGETARHSDIANRGLRSMAAAFFDVRISKRAQCSNWALEQLQPYQITYAATDAWISRELYVALAEMSLVDVQRDKAILQPVKPKRPPRRGRRRPLPKTPNSES
ncbi:3'-5' exonuclease [Magnetococcus sp. PR-3]|uniref:3'-5' exonuclease n=1 Tax=Magnetococcus sp. PR-3 TaxID=3120355 RepID=UPI002FCE65CE